MSPKTVLHLTDLHILPDVGASMLGVDTNHYFERTLQHAHQQHGPFDLILLTGDLAQDPCEASYQRIAEQLKRYRTPCVCLPGNHDDFTMMTATFNQDNLSCAKQTTLGNWRIIGLNSQKQHSPVGRLEESELVFLRQSLEAHPESPTLLALHHPCIASGSSWLDTMQIENSDALLAIVKPFAQLKAIACGHLHQALERQIAHMTLYATPSTCFQFKPKADAFSLDTLSPGYRIFELHEDGLLHSDCYRIPETLTTLDTSSQCY